MKSRGIHRFGLVLSFSSTEAFYGMARIDSGVQLQNEGGKSSFLENPLMIANTVTLKKVQFKPK